MISEIIVGKNAQHAVWKQKQCVKVTSPQQVTVILPAYNQEVSIGSIFLLSKFYAGILYAYAINAKLRDIYYGFNNCSHACL